LANGEKIVEFVNEIYGGLTPPELDGLGQGPARRLEQKEAARKAQAAQLRPLLRP